MAANQAIEYTPQFGDLTFWCTAIAYNSNPPINDSKARPLKEYLIKFSVMNRKKPLILDYKTFVESTGLDYAKGNYVSHPSPEAVPSGNYSSSEQINSIQQMIAYCLITGTKVDIGETERSFTGETFRSSPTILINLNFSKDPSKVTEIELTASMIAVNNQKDSVSPLPFFGNKKKVKSQTVTPTLTKSQGPEASGAFSKKRQKPKSSNVPDPQDLERNIQLVGTGLPFTSLDEGIRKSQPLPESKTADPKDLGETFSPLIKDCLP
ncbi:hypothetical protein Tco_1554078 [Tanacetum coccineum]